MVAVVIVVILMLALIVYSQAHPLRKQRPKKNSSYFDKNKYVSDLNTTFDRCKKVFLNLDVKKYSNQIVIREHVGLKVDPKDLVYISLNPNKPKSLSQHGAFVVARNPTPPTKQEMRSDFARVLNQY